jgi:GDP/UDP-N,N'-diacetylbacillosamine 2-epimerase (hydrolysing)
MTRKICVVTGSRADYGLLRSVMQGIKNDPNLIIQVIATGMHLSPTFGLTYKEIESDGFFIDEKVEVITEIDTPEEISQSIAKGITGCAKAFNRLEPDLILLLGDRYEIFSAAIAAHVALIPIAHIHGGELTGGALDEAFRHSISKMSSLHFVAAEEYKKRLIQLGENPKSIYLAGGLGVDSIKKYKLLNKYELENELNIKFLDKSLLITFHPETLDIEGSEFQFKELLKALSNFKDTTLIFTMPNADTGGRKLINMVKEFVIENKNAKAFTSLGQLLYFSCILNMDGVVGNSSSGVIEVPSFKKATVNIGDRQLGRLQAESIINCKPLKKDILNAIEKLYSSSFQTLLDKVINPYSGTGVNEKIIEILGATSLDGIIKKAFQDL